MLVNVACIVVSISDLAKCRHKYLLHNTLLYSEGNWLVDYMAVWSNRIRLSRVQTSACMRDCIQSRRPYLHTSELARSPGLNVVRWDLSSQRSTSGRRVGRTGHIPTEYGRTRSQQGPTFPLWSMSESNRNQYFIHPLIDFPHRQSDYK